MWYKIFNFNIFDEKSQQFELLKGGYVIPIINVKWNVNSGDFVKKGDCIMTCDYDNEYYRKNPRNSYMQDYDKKIIFYALSDGFIYIRQDKKESFHCEKNTILCAICDTENEYKFISKNNECTIFTKDYSNYVKVGTPYKVTYSDNDSVKYFNIATSHKADNSKIYLHPFIKCTDKLAIKITSWLFLNDDNRFWSLGNNFNGRNNFIYINEDYSIDVIADDVSVLIRHESSLPDFIKFKEISGNFSIYFYQTYDDTKITLKGCPNIVHGNFECSRCRLTKFENVPTYVGGDFIAKTNSISSFVGMPKYISGCFNIANNEFDDAAWEYAKENIDGEFCDYNIANNKFVKYRKELY